MRGQRGFVLVNALVLVLVISVIATGLLHLAGEGRVRLREAQLTDQVQLYLDAAEALVAANLEDDRAESDIDHHSEPWARPIHAAEIGRGRADIRVVDLQGRLDLNRLVDAGPADRETFARLFEALDLPQGLLSAIEAYLARGGPGAAGYADRPEPIRPRGGPMAFVEELRQVDGMTEAAFQRLAPFVAALPEAMPLNPNTAPVEVLRAVLPAGETEVVGFARSRDERPIEDEDDLLDRLSALLGPAAGGVAAGMTIASSLFEAIAVAQLEERVLARRIAFRREDDGRIGIYTALALPDPALAMVEIGR